MFVNYLSGISAAFVAASFIYNLGYFSVIGGDWVEDLVLTDLFSNFWTIFVKGFVVFSWIGVLSFLSLRGRAINFYYDNEGFFKEKHAKKFGVIQLILSLTVTVIIFFVGFISLIESTFNCYVLLMPFALAIIVFILPVLLYLWPEKKDVTPRNILLTVCGCIALFSFGHDQAWLATFYGSTFRVNLENDKPICGRIVFRGERGILIENGKSGHQVFLPRGRIKSTESAATIVCKDLNGHKAA